MAGNYPDAPSWRMAYDRDGTQVFRIDSVNAITQLTSAQLVAINDEGEGTYTVVSGAGSGRLVFIFPELRDLDAFFFIGTETAQTMTIAVSADTTNGLDGTWTTISTQQLWSGTVKTAYRTLITSTTALAVRAVRFYATTTTFNSFVLKALHLYGEPVPGANPNRLELWHPTADEKLTPAFFDWGDVPRSSSADRVFRVKNLSGSLTAGSTRVAMEALTDASPSVPAQHTLSYGGGSFLAQVNIGDLAPGAISGPVTLRRVTPSNAALSLWSFRVFAESTNWA